VKPSVKTFEVPARPKPNKNGDVFDLAAQIRGALQQHVGVAVSADTVKQTVLDTLPKNFPGEVSVSQDSRDPTTVNVTMSLPVQPYIVGTYEVTAPPRVIHGGSWVHDNGDLKDFRSASRNYYAATVGDIDDLGFRTSLRGRQPRAQG
jgi:hypothetical protein